MRATRKLLHVEKLHIRGAFADEHLRVTQSTTVPSISLGLYAMRFVPFAANVAESHQLFGPCSVRPYFVQTQEQCFRVAYVAYNSNIKCRYVKLTLLLYSGSKFWD